MCEHQCGCELLPREVRDEWRDFLLAGKSGSLTVHAKDGHSLTGSITIAITVDRSQWTRVER